MKLKVTEDNIFVKVVEEKGGIVHIPPVFRRRNQVAMKGTVMHRGPKAIVKKGDKIIFNKWQDNEITIDGKKLLLIKPFSILAVQ